MKDLVGRKARIVNSSIFAMVGITVEILYVENLNNIIIGLPKECCHGWLHSNFPGYKCWYIDLDRLEILNPITRSKFR